MAQNPLVEQAKQGHVNAIASLMNRLLKSQAMLANVERNGDRLEILIESDLRSLDDEVRVPKRQILVGMLKKWFVTLEVQNVSSIVISWQQTGFDEPAWTEEIFLVEQDINQSGEIEIEQLPEPPKIPPLPVFSPRTINERDRPNSAPNSETNPVAAAPDLDEMFGEGNNITPNITPLTNLDADQPTSASESELLFLSDVPSISDIDSDIENINEVQPAIANSSNSSAWQTLLKTPSFAMQFVQYCVVCAIVILTIRGIHGVLASPKAPKAAAISPQIILL